MQNTQLIQLMILIFLQYLIIYINMAFIGQSKRQNLFINNLSLGPGLYNIQSEQNKKNNYAPFSSLQPKFNNKIDSKNTTLGPGYYQVSKGIGKPSFTKIENDHNIIIKINDFGSSAFRSEVQRFNNIQNQMPGPGHYLKLKQSSYEKKRNKSTKSNQYPILLTLKQMNKQYQQSKEVSLIKSFTQYKKQIDNVGPGRYNTQSQFDKLRKVRGIKWDYSKEERFKTQETDEPDQFFSKKVEQLKKQKIKEKEKKPSPFFRSQAIKSFFDQIYYETNSSLKAQIRKRVNYKSSNPAPGSYLPVYKQLDLKNAKFQFFGSTEERFKSQIKNEVGPGDYIVNDNFKKEFKKQRIDRTKRISLQKNEQIPGPGTYNLSKSFLHKRGRIEQFGSLLPRFKEQYIQQQQFPPQINSQPPKQKQKQEMNTNIFRSSTTRDCFTNKQKQKIPFGQYDVCKQDISSKQNKKKKYLMHLEYCFLKRPAFDSSIQRFKQKRNPSVQIQSMDKYQSKQKSNINQMQQKKSESGCFKSKSIRKLFETKNKGPGVGTYQYKQKLLLKSFNKKYQNNYNKKFAHEQELLQKIKQSNMSKSVLKLV